MHDFLQTRKHDFLILPESHSNEARLVYFNNLFKGKYRMYASHFEGEEKQQVSSGGIAVFLRTTSLSSSKNRR